MRTWSTCIYANSLERLSCNIDDYTDRNSVSLRSVSVVPTPGEGMRYGAIIVVEDKDAES